MTERAPAAPPVRERPDQRKLATVTRTLAQLNANVDERRAELMTLRRELAEVPRDFSASPASLLVEANQQLVLAALLAEAIAESAVGNLDELARASQRDVLTDTPNRALMLDRLETAIAMAKRHRTRIAVLFVDLDHFKQINDRLGHAGGDEVLQLTARRLEQAVRDSDTVSRHSGDEFLVLLSEVSQPDDAALIAEKMLATLAAPARVVDQVLSLSASIGIAIYPEDGEYAATLISQADAAMYRAKRGGGQAFEFHSALSPSDDETHELSITGALELPAPLLELPPEQDSRLRDLREANEQLVIAALTAQELEAHAAEAHRRQIKFLAMVAHELRNPLTPIRTVADILKHGRPDAAMLAQLQAIIEGQVAHMARLIDDLLDGSRLSTGKFRLDRSTVDAIGALRQAVDTCRPEMEMRRQRLLAPLPIGPLKVQGDPVRLAQIFSNLLDNASKYTPEGGEIALAVEEINRALVITISDNGIGITADTLPYIFDLFVQDNSALSRRNGGLGIGLAVVRELVEAHDGTVVVWSPGRNLGSKFIVTLPMADEFAAT
ncbi:MAG: diguanylate cyclase [Thiohalobacteraceae bacterium]